MSTNKTANYNLHAWAPEDDFLRAEFNENFSLIDGLLGELPRNKKLRIITGSYLGTGNEQTIELPFTPKALLVVTNTDDDHSVSALALPGVETTFAALSGSAFTVSGMLNIAPGSSFGIASGSIANPYRYLAIGWEE